MVARMLTATHLLKTVT